MRISKSIKIIVVVLLVFSLTSTISVFYQLNKMENDGRVVNYTGIVRGATQRLVKLEMSGKSSDELIAMLDKIINGLVEGDAELGLPKATDENFLLKMEEVGLAWGELTQGIYQNRTNNNSNKLLALSENYFQITNDAVSSTENFSIAKVIALKTIQILIFVLNLMILGVIWVMSGKRISKPLMHLVETIGRLDISENIPDDFMMRKDEIGLLSNAFQKVVDNLRELVKQISELSKQVADFSKELTVSSNQSATAAEEVAKTIEEIAQGAYDQAKDTEQGVLHVTDLGELIEKDQKFVHELNISADKVNNLKNEGLETIKELVKKTTANNEASKQIGAVILSSNESAGKIENASHMIKSIADQTNLLALNAAIEAARAGDSGRGFAVVAEEIRKLAEQSNGFTEEISKVVKDLTYKTKDAVDTMGAMTKLVASQTESVDLTSTKFEGIAQAIEKMKDVITVINNSGQEMALKKNEIVSIMENLSAISEENAAGTQEASASVEEQTASMTEIANASETLAKLAAEMQKSVSKFKY